MSKRPVVTLLTDFGLADHYVAAMKGVILGICPDALLVDISHEIRAFAIEDAAFTLAQAWPYFPKGTVHVTVVDPGVGSERRALLAKADGHHFVAPDNGVLTHVFDAARRIEAREITAARYFREPVSRTFHGRDIFAPVAAAVASGIDAAKFGKKISDPVRFASGTPQPAGEDIWTGSVLRIDRFGNVVTSFGIAEFGEAVSRKPFEVAIGCVTVSCYAEQYSAAPAGRPVLIPGSSGYLEISCNQADAAKATGAVHGSPVTLRIPQHGF